MNEGKGKEKLKKRKTSGKKRLRRGEKYWKRREKKKGKERRWEGEERRCMLRFISDSRCDGNSRQSKGCLCFYCVFI